MLNIVSLITSVVTYLQTLCIHNVGVGLYVGVYCVLTDVLLNNLNWLNVVPHHSLHPHLFVVLLEHDELVLQALILTLQIHPGQIHLVQHPLQSCDVRLHSHPHGQLVLIPKVEWGWGGSQTGQTGFSELLRLEDVS